MKKNVPQFIKEKNIPIQFLQFYNYVTKLEFYEEPNYSYLKNLLSIMAREKLINFEDTFFDWSLKLTLLKYYPITLQLILR